MQELENYKKEKLTIDLVWANLFGLLILVPIVLLYGLPYYFMWKPEIKQIVKSAEPQVVALGFLIMILGIVLHEFIHGITWAKYAKAGFKSIKFGVLWKMITPYCHCKEALTVKQYIIGAIMPSVFLGIAPAVIAILIGNISLLIFGMFFTLAACGDFLIINLIRKQNSNDLVQDHPSEAGCYIYRKIE